MRKTALLIIAGVDYELINSLTYSDDGVVWHCYVKPFSHFIVISSHGVDFIKV